MYKIIFIDIDGTLRNDKKEITNRTKEAIQNIVQKGIQVVICSGRNRMYTENVSREALASNYVIACNGAEIYNYKEKEIIYENNLEKDNMIKLYKIAERCDTQLVINSRDKRITRLPTKYETDIILKEPIEEFVKDNFSTQYIFSTAILENIKRARNEISHIDDVEIVNLSKSLVNDNVPTEQLLFLDVTCKDTSKGNAIKKLCEHLKINLEDSVAIGDSYNDLTMFKVVGHSVAMGNAADDIKELVDEIIDTNNEDGVAKFLEKI